MGQAARKHSPVLSLEHGATAAQEHFDQEHFDRATCLLTEGNALFHQGDAQGALTKYEECRACGKKIRDASLARQVEGSATGSLGDAYNSIGKYATAGKHHKLALAVARETGDRQGEGNALGNLALSYFGFGHHPEAIDHYNQALAVVREIGDRSGEAQEMGNLGLVYFSLGQYTEAIRHHELALAISRQIGDRRGEGQDLSNLGLAWFGFGHHAVAISHFKKALAIVADIGDRDGSILGNLVPLEQQGWVDLSRALEHGRVEITRLEASSSGPMFTAAAKAAIAGGDVKVLDSSTPAELTEVCC
jgi:tetratricopeptide (TPR) repeat protein